MSQRISIDLGILKWPEFYPGEHAKPHFTEILRLIIYNEIYGHFLFHLWDEITSKKVCISFSVDRWVVGGCCQFIDEAEL